MSNYRYCHSEIEQFVREFNRDGFCLFRGHFPTEKIAIWRENFAPILKRHIELEGDRKNRGAERYYVTLPFAEPFADESIFADPDILAIVEKLVGEDFTMVQLATDTPLFGSEYQEIHRDAPPLFPESGQETPSFQLALNFPLVDVTPENGPFEVARKTHLMTKEDGLSAIASGALPLEAVSLQIGDVLLRDVRGLHRGTPNQTPEPRPMVVVGYSRKWLFRPEVSINIPREIWENLSAASKHMLRFNRIVESLDSSPGEEIYQAFAY